MESVNRLRCGLPDGFTKPVKPPRLSRRLKNIFAAYGSNPMSNDANVWSDVPPTEPDYYWFISDLQLEEPSFGSDPWIVNIRWASKCAIRDDPYYLHWKRDDDLIAYRGHCNNGRSMEFSFVSEMSGLWCRVVRPPKLPRSGPLPEPAEGADIPDSSRRTN